MGFDRKNVEIASLQMAATDKRAEYEFRYVRCYLLSTITAQAASPVILSKVRSISKTRSSA